MRHKYGRAILDEPYSPTVVWQGHRAKSLSRIICCLNKLNAHHEEPSSPFSGFSFLLRSLRSPPSVCGRTNFQPWPVHSPIIANMMAEKVPGKVKWNQTSLQPEQLSDRDVIGQRPLHEPALDLWRPKASDIRA